MVTHDRRKHVASRVYVFSEHAIYCDSLRSLIDGRWGMRVVGSTTDSTTLASLAHACRSDVLLVDLHAPLGPKSKGMADVFAVCGSLPTLVMAPVMDFREVDDAIRQGIRGVMLKRASAETLFIGIRAVATGSCWIDPAIVASLVRFLTDGPPPQNGLSHARFGLTAREIEIVSVVLEGGANKQIAVKCGISEKTVKHHLTNIFDKVGVSNRLELAVFAMEHQLVMRP